MPTYYKSQDVIDQWQTITLYVFLSLWLITHNKCSQNSDSVQAPNTFTGLQNMFWTRFKTYVCIFPLIILIKTTVWIYPHITLIHFIVNISLFFKIQQWPYERNLESDWNQLHGEVCTWVDLSEQTQIARFMGPTWGPPGSCRPQVGPM